MHCEIESNKNAIFHQITQVYTLTEYILYSKGLVQSQYLIIPTKLSSFCFRAHSYPFLIQNTRMKMYRWVLLGSLPSGLPVYFIKRL